MAIVRLRGPLRKLGGGRAEHALDGATVAEVLRALERQAPALSGWILDERAHVRRHLHVFVNGDHGEEDTPLRPDDVVDVLPAISGGG
jgi:molybdopterin converting factor small subunit